MSHDVSDQGGDNQRHWTGCMGCFDVTDCTSGHSTKHTSVLLWNPQRYSEEELCESMRDRNILDGVMIKAGRGQRLKSKVNEHETRFYSRN